MPTKTGKPRPRVVHGGYGSAMTSDSMKTKSAKPARNRNRVTSAKPAPVGRRQGRDR